MHTLDAAIRAYFQASNAHDYDGLTALFATDAAVEDEGRVHGGLSEIRRWAESTQREYSFTLQPLESYEEDGSTVVSCRVSGEFPGSPVDLHFAFALANDKIVALKIRD